MEVKFKYVNQLRQIINETNSQAHDFITFKNIYSTI